MNAKKSLTLASASALAAGVAQGSVVYSGPLNLQQTFTSSNYRQGVSMVTGGGTNDFVFGYETASNKPYVDARYVSLSDVSPNPNVSGIVGILGTTTGASAGTVGLPVTPAGTMIDSTYASAYSLVQGGRGYMYDNDQGNTVIGAWSNTAITEGFVGIELTLTAGTSYGWLHFIDDPIASSPTLTLVDWAYESTPGVGIQTSIIPEPSAAALTGLGIAALLVLRKRK